MICELFPFQKQAVNEMRLRVAMALNNYRMLKIPQVVSLQAPTGSGKTIIMSALIEDIFYGSEQFTEQPEAIFVWLSDSPQLNEQSKQKIELKADKVRMDQCVVISDESFDREILEDGHIYFLNTQKLGKAGNLSRHSDTRQYTIWETIENTARENAKKLLKAKNSPVLQMKKNDLLENLKKHSRYKTMFKFEEDHIVISSQKEAAAFIKMLNDDIVRSELTGKEYDSSSKMLLAPMGSSQ